MNAFDKVIGYEPVKRELSGICDMLRNPEPYEALGAKVPKGVLLYGEPGLGKKMMAECLIEESGLDAVTVRRGRSGGDFIEEIASALRQAKEMHLLCYSNSSLCC